MPLLDVDPLTGAVETMQYLGKGELLIQRRTNHDAVLDANTASYNDNAEQWRGQANDLWHVGRVPEDVLYIWLQEFNAIRPPDERVRSPYLENKDWEDFMWLRLNSSEYRKLKTAPVHV